MLGVMSVDDGVRHARNAGLDLVEVSPNANPPVCKIIDYGKYKYEHQKRLNEAKKKQKQVTIKEIKVRPNIDEHDLQVKKKAMQKFFDAGDKVKVTLRFRGREMAHTNIGFDVLERLKEEFDGVAKVETEAKMEGRQAIMIMVPEVAKVAK